MLVDVKKWEFLSFQVYSHVFLLIECFSNDGGQPVTLSGFFNLRDALNRPFFNSGRLKSTKI
jgi:hypothetical protein